MNSILTAGLPGLIDSPVDKKRPQHSPRTAVYHESPVRDGLKSATEAQHCLPSLSRYDTARLELYVT